MFVNILWALLPNGILESFHKQLSVYTNNATQLLPIHLRAMVSDDSALMSLQPI